MVVFSISSPAKRKTSKRLELILFPETYIFVATTIDLWFLIKSMGEIAK